MRAREMTRNRWVAVLFFALYILLLFYLLFFSELNGRGLLNREHMSYNLYPFREIKRYIFHWKQIGLLSSFLNLFGNIIMFIPFGFLGWLNAKYFSFKKLIVDFLSALIIV